MSLEIIPLIESFCQSLESLPFDGSDAVQQNRTVQEIANKILSISFEDIEDLSEEEYSNYKGLSLKISQRVQKMEESSSFWRKIFPSRAQEKAAQASSILNNVAISREKLERRRQVAEFLRDPPVLTDAVCKGFWDLVLKMLLYKESPIIALSALQFFAQEKGDFLCSVLEDIPDLDPYEALQFGVLFQDPIHQNIFCNRFKIGQKTLEEAIFLGEKNADIFSGPHLENGICLGFTLAKIQSPKAAHEDLISKSRFLQASHQLTFRDVKKEKFFKTGKELLKDPKAYPTITAIVFPKAARLLGKTEEELMALYQDPDEARKIASFVGMVASKNYNLAHQRLLERLNEGLSQIGKCSSDEERDLLCDEASALQEEFSSFSKLISEDKKNYSRPNIEFLLTDKLKIGKNPVICAENIPVKELSKTLTSLEIPMGKGACKLSLLPKDNTEEAHAIYLSLEPLEFCDLNDLDLITGLPRRREGFKTVEEMADALQQVLFANYGPNFWESFSLLFYERL